jgi:chromosome partitioning protein
MARTIAVLSQKGGTGKTTVVRTLADAFRRGGARTLAIDLDPQGNLSDYFDPTADAEPTIADVLSGRARAAEAIRRDLIPANLTLAETELTLAGKIGRELALRRALTDVAHEYELVLIDCPPSLGLLTVNALVAADRALISAEAQYFALRGVEQALDMVELARDSLNPELSLLGILLNLADMRTVHSRATRAALEQRFHELVFGTVVRASIAYAESAKLATSILDHRPDLGADYLALAAEVLERLPPLRDARERSVTSTRGEHARYSSQAGAGTGNGSAESRSVAARRRHDLEPVEQALERRRDGIRGGGVAHDEQRGLVERPHQQVGERVDVQRSDLAGVDRAADDRLEQPQPVALGDLPPALPAEHRRAVDQRDPLDLRRAARLEEGSHAGA